MSFLGESRVERQDFQSRSRSFGVSLLVHACAVAGWLLIGAAVPGNSSNEPVHHYSVRLLQLQPLERYPIPQLPQPQKRLTMAAAGGGQRANPAAAARAGVSAAARTATLAEAPEALRRSFVMPPLAAAQPVRQTLLQSDLPPNIPLNQPVPLPALMVVSEERAMRVPVRHFVAPSAHVVEAKTTSRVLASAPAQGNEIALSSLQMALNSSMTDLVRLPVPAAPSAPIRTYAVRPVKAARTARKEGAAPELSIVSITDNPALPTDILAVPPANQIGAAGAPRAGSEQPGAAAAGLDDAPGQGTGGKAGTGLGADKEGSLDSAGHLGSAAAGSGSAQSAGLRAAGAAGTGVGDGTGTAGGSLEADTTGMSKLTFPKEGQFGVTVLGSSAASPYPETEGALGGKLIYTVYVKVGQRKNWILQYCLGKTSLTHPHAQGTRTPLEAPWPYTILRPEHPLDNEYVLVHGTITAEGSFDQLALLFPTDLGQKDLLLRSLNQWAFRPATKDGEPTAVEVLLIIPRETD